MRGNVEFEKHTFKSAIGCIARFFKTKGHVYLIEALKQLIREIPKVRLILFGGESNQALIEDQVREAGLGEYIIFAGHRKDVAACIGAMDLIVHPSLAASAVVFHAENGILIPPKKPQAIVDAVLHLY